MNKKDDILMNCQYSIIIYWSEINPHYKFIHEQLQTKYPFSDRCYPIPHQHNAAAVPSRLRFIAIR